MLQDHLIDNPRILEGLVTTLARADVFPQVAISDINIAPMGPIVDEAMTRLILRPFTSSTTYRNLKATGQGVFHITDDALMIARGAVGKITARWRDEDGSHEDGSRKDESRKDESHEHGRSDDETAGRPAGQVRGHEAIIRPADCVRSVVLTGACRYHEFEVTALDDSQERTRIEARVVHAGVLREFIGFCRAKHAVLEAAILATRLHLTGKDAVLAQFEPLQTIIDKTGGQAEHQAMTELRYVVEQWAGEPSA